MSFRPGAKLSDVTQLKTVLLTSGLQQKNNALYQVINQLLDYLKRNQDITDTSIETIINNAFEFPIDSIFTTAVNTNPLIMLGYGTWQLVAIGSGDSGSEMVISIF